MFILKLLIWILLVAQFSIAGQRNCKALSEDIFLEWRIKDGNLLEMTVLSQKTKGWTAIGFHSFGQSCYGQDCPLDTDVVVACSGPEPRIYSMHQSGLKESMQLSTNQILTRTSILIGSNKIFNFSRTDIEGDVKLNFTSSQTILFETSEDIQQMIFQQFGTWEVDWLHHYACELPKVGNQQREDRNPSSSSSRIQIMGILSLCSLLYLLPWPSLRVWLL